MDTLKSNGQGLRNYAYIAVASGITSTRQLRCVSNVPVGLEPEDVINSTHYSVVGPTHQSEVDYD